jgi:GNAT superfamily N-acetyltransferase
MGVVPPVERPEVREARLQVLPADQAGFAVVEAVLGLRGPAASCQCQRYKLHPHESFARQPVELRAERLQAQVEGTYGEGARTSGLVAYLDDEPVGWCAVEPRRNYHGLVRNQKVPWAGRNEDRADPHVWAVTCLYVVPGSRRRGVSRALVEGAVEAASAGGAHALEAYPMTTTSALPDELHPGLLTTFLEAGFAEVTRPTARRAVVRLELPAER